jgi:hypothetical protein
MFAEVTATNRPVILRYQRRKTPMKPLVFRLQFYGLRRPHVLLLGRAVLLDVALYRFNAPTIIWRGPTGADTNWSTCSNWTNATACTFGTAPASGDDVKFFDTGSVGSASNINNTVDASFPGTIASLQFSNTNNTHTTLISSETKLNITGEWIVVGTPVILVSPRCYKHITGAGGTLNLNNTSAAGFNQGPRRCQRNARDFDLSGLDSFTMNGNRIGIGDDASVPVRPINARRGCCFSPKPILSLCRLAALATYQTTGAKRQLSWPTIRTTPAF